MSRMTPQTPAPLDGTKDDAVVKIGVYRDGWTKRLQLDVGDADGGYRLAGPKFNGSSVLLLEVTLDQRDADEIRRYLDAVFR